MSTKILAAFLIASLWHGERGAKLGSRLREGTVLVYSSAGVETPWTIDSLASDTVLGGRAGCVRMRIRLSPTQREASTRAYCADSTTLWTWDDRAQVHRAARPIAGGQSLELNQASGSTIRYDTSPPKVETIGGIALEVIPTTVTTIDSTGTATRRLRERFSIDLVTATGGAFEVPDTTQTGGWRIERQFELVAIRR